MRYTKPAVLSCFMASTSVMGIPKAQVGNDNDTSGSQPFLSSSAAYEADE